LSQNLVLSTLKKCETSDAYALRYYNATDSVQSLKLAANFSSVAEGGLNEAVRKKLTPAADGTYSDLLPNQVKTFILQ